ncbi:MAG: hypothetical protein HPY51_09035 [Candidatus Omnitrophica bacterium]|nr:hypothetical protein [Candidatus Omnitrophota bacterium]
MPRMDVYTQDDFQEKQDECFLAVGQDLFDEEMSFLFPRHGAGEEQFT